MKRILFVDDEPRVLQGLRRMLHPMRREWEMTFVGSGREALEMLERAEFDVVVSDLRMPEMDGVTLLGEVMQRHPNVVRIVLSGDTDEQVVLKYVGKSHLFLSKPCDADTLVSTVARACGLRDTLAQPELRKLIARIERLPSLPTLYLELSAELKRPDPSVRRIGQIVSRDVAMTARVLQLVNSAYFGFFGRVTDPERAVVLLGIKTIQSLVLSFRVFAQFDQSRVKVFRIDTLMNHCTATGTLARMMARMEGRAGQDAANDAFTAGLLHDIGKLVLADSMPSRYAQVLATARQAQVPMWVAEKEMLGATHGEVGAYLVGLWGLPQTVVEAIAYHHSPSRSAVRSFTPLTAIHVADAWEYESRPTEPGQIAPQVDMKHLGALGLAARLDTWRSRCQAALQERNAA